MNKPEPEIDWSKVPAGTPVEVRDVGEKWFRGKQFLAFTPDDTYQYWVKSIPPWFAVGWKLCRLAPGIEVKEDWLK